MRRRPELLFLLAAFLCLWAGCRPTRPPSPPAPERSASGAAFRDVAAERGIDFRLGHGGRSPLSILDTANGGCGFLDYDRDGRLDLVLVGQPRCRVYRNEGTRFRDATDDLGLKEAGRWMGCAIADYDGDGFPDLLLTGFRCLALLHNEQGKRFRPVTAPSGLRTDRWTTSADFADIDRDGDLDLYVGAYVAYHPGTRDTCQQGPIQTACGPELYAPEQGRFYLNEGNGRFREATREAGLGDAAGKTWGVLFTDFDGDGWPDLYLGNDRMPCNLYRNRHDGTFAETGLNSGTAFGALGNAMGAMGVDSGDGDGDGRPDLFVTTYFQEADAFFRNQGQGLFREDSERVGIAQPTRSYVGFGSGFIDVDNDGDLDLFCANGHVRDNAATLDSLQKYAQPLQLFLNDGRCNFVDATETTPGISGVSMVGRGAAFGDFDGDGKMDILAVDLEGAARLLRNETDTAGRQWIRLELAGGKGNSEALGARITLKTGAGRLIRQVKRGGSVLSAHDCAVLAGLGPEASADVEVRWPDGQVRAWSRLAAGRTHRLKR